MACTFIWFLESLPHWFDNKKWRWDVIKVLTVRLWIANRKHEVYFSHHCAFILAKLLSRVSISIIHNELLQSLRQPSWSPRPRNHGDNNQKIFFHPSARRCTSDFGNHREWIVWNQEITIEFSEGKRNWGKSKEEKCACT